MGEDVGEGEREAGGSTERDRNAGKKSPSSEVVEEGGRGGASGSLLWGWREEGEVELWLTGVVGRLQQRVHLPFRGPHSLFIVGILG